MIKMNGDIWIEKEIKDLMDGKDVGTLFVPKGKLIKRKES